MRDRIRVPLLGYFVVVTPLLLGGMIAADAYLGPPEPMRGTVDTPVLALTKRASTANAVQILTVRESMPVPLSALAAANDPPTGAVGKAAPSKLEQAKKKSAQASADQAKRKRTKIVPTRHARGLYARASRPLHAVW
jgi:hypothetical protein